MTEQEVRELKILAAKIRIATIECIQSRGFGHIGGALSIADALAVLYGKAMRYKTEDPSWPERDKLVCSKGHAGPGIYGALAVAGFFPYEQLKTLNRPGTLLPSHCDRNRTRGVDMTTGSLGQGCSEAVGLALADKLMDRDSVTYLIVGDGELDEGQCWEAAMFAAGKKLDNMVWLIDLNKKQLDGYTKDVLDTFDFEAKFRAFGFEAKTVDGNDVAAVWKAIEEREAGKPLAVVLDTVKGKGVREIEETMSNHHMAVSTEVFETWLNEVRAELVRLEA